MYSRCWCYQWVKTKLGWKLPLSISQVFSFNIMGKRILNPWLTGMLDASPPIINCKNRYKRYYQSILSVYSRSMWIKWRFPKWQCYSPDFRTVFTLYCSLVAKILAFLSFLHTFTYIVASVWSSLLYFPEENYHSQVSTCLTLTLELPPFLCL